MLTAESHRSFKQVSSAQKAINHLSSLESCLSSFVYYPEILYYAVFYPIYKFPTTPHCYEKQMQIFFVIVWSVFIEETFEISHKGYTLHI